MYRDNQFVKSQYTIKLNYWKKNLFIENVTLCTQNKQVTTVTGHSKRVCSVCALQKQNVNEVIEIRNISRYKTYDRKY